MFLTLKLSCSLLLFFLIEAQATCDEGSIDYLLDNHDMIYQNFLPSPRQPNPHHPANLDAGTCCLSFSEVEVPVGSSAKFESPNFPHKYPSDMDCGWNFTTDPGHVFDMQCHFKHLKSNDYLDMKENNSFYSYVENVKEKEMIHYFWSNEVSVGFHSDRETGVEGFECEIWPVSGCSHPAPATASEVVGDVQIPHQFDSLIVRYKDHDYQVIADDGTHEQSLHLAPHLTDYLGATDGFISKIENFIKCDEVVNNCYYLGPKDTWELMTSLKVLPEEYPRIRFATYIKGRAIFATEKALYQVYHNHTVLGQAVDWADSANTMCLTSDGSVPYIAFIVEGTVYVRKGNFYDGGALHFEDFKSFPGILPAPETLGCVVTEANLYVGGYILPGNVHAFMTQISLVDDSDPFIFELPLQLFNFKMAVIDGLPAVVGGYDVSAGKLVDTVYIADEITKEWRTSSLKLNHKKEILQLFQNKRVY